MRVLGIETSCDETSAAVVEQTGDPERPWRLRSNVVASQVASVGYISRWIVVVDDDVDPTDIQIRVRNHVFRVLGVMQTKGSSGGGINMDDQVFTPYTTVMKKLTGQTSIQRIYATAFFKKDELEQHLHNLEEAKKRDHRKLGKELRLFHIDEKVGPGLILWTPNGAVVRQELQNFISEQLFRTGYRQVFTPHIGNLDLYRTSGHFPYYKDAQFPPLVEREAMELLAKEGCGCGELTNRLADGTVVAARQGKLLATSFHPELTADQRLHAYFLGFIARRP